MLAMCGFSYKGPLGSFTRFHSSLFVTRKVGNLFHKSNCIIAFLAQLPRHHLAATPVSAKLPSESVHKVQRFKLQNPSQKKSFKFGNQTPLEL